MGLAAAKILAYAQGLALIAAASNEYGWNTPLADVARGWRGGCIIRASLLSPIIAAFTANPQLPGLLHDAAIVGQLCLRQGALRRTVAVALTAGVSVPALAASLAYFDSARRTRLPGAALIQARRDFFGAHTFKRQDREGTFHEDWQSHL